MIQIIVAVENKYNYVYGGTYKKVSPMFVNEEIYKKQ